MFLVALWDIFCRQDFCQNQGQNQGFGGAKQGFCLSFGCRRWVFMEGLVALDSYAFTIGRQGPRQVLTDGWVFASYAGEGKCPTEKTTHTLTPQNPPPPERSHPSN
jgi:hypothetical protein